MDGFLNDILIPNAENLLINSSPWFKSLIVDGIISGVGGIIVLLPTNFSVVYMYNYIGR